MLSGICAGASVALAKLALTNLSAAAYGTYACSMTALTLFLRLFLTGRFRLKGSSTPWLPLIGHLFGSFFTVWTFWEGTKLLSAPVASFLAQSELIFIFLFSSLFLGERLKRADITATVIILLGVTIVADVDPLEVLTSFTDQRRGIAFVLLSSVLFGITETFSKKIANRMDTFTLVCLRNTFMGVMFFKVALSQHTLASVDLQTGLVIAASALLGQLLARLTFMQALKTLDLGKTALLFRVEPFVVTILSLLIFHELPTIPQLVGGLLIIGGCVVVYFGHRQAVPGPTGPKEPDLF